MNQNTVQVRLLMALCLVLKMTPGHAETRLITEEEARAPSGSTTSTRAITRGPTITLLSPSEVNGKSFNFKLALEPRGGAQIDPASVKFEYLKQPLIDLTSRFKAGVKGNTVEIADAAVAPGTHSIRVSVKDSEGRQAQSVIQLNAK